MNIGIITFQRAHNYGAVLQAYALLTTLQSMGHNVEVIDYWPKYRSGHYNLFYFDAKKNIKKRFSTPGLKNLIKEVISFPLRYRQYQKFKNFIRYDLKVGSRPFQLGSDTPDKYDIIICGSDQIWRYNFRGNRGFDRVYFAQYPVRRNIIKIAYAASMGDDAIDENAERMLSKLLENFDFISVREHSLLELIKPLTTVKPVKVLDPVFLLSDAEWRKIIRKNSNKKKYLLFYQLLPSVEALNLAKKIARERQLEIVHLRGVKRDANPFENGNLKLAAGPLDFISLIANADYVVSTSYHGVVFSIVFRKQFSALGFKGNFYRIKSLLTSMGIEERLIEKNSGDYANDIDYVPVNHHLSELIKNSLSFIAGSIKEVD